MKVIVGLGNPGSVYEKTYHNIGFMAVDTLSQMLNIPFTKAKFHSLIGEGEINGEKVILQKPFTFMNNSGEAVNELAHFYHVDSSDVIVFCDDIDLDKGVCRFREHGSAGTHNGLKSIVHFIGEDFKRIKIGAGNDKSMDLKDYVLSKMDDESLLKISSAIDEGIKKLFGLFR